MQIPGCYGESQVNLSPLLYMEDMLVLCTQLSYVIHLV